MTWDVYKGILGNYGNNILFELCVYSYIKRDTLLQLTDARLVSRVSVFLYECCRDLNETVEAISTIKNNPIMERIFIWQFVARKKDQTNRLCEFLKQRFGLKWVNFHQTRFEKIHDDNALKISSNSNFVLITLNDTLTKANLKINGKNEKGCELRVEVRSEELFDIIALNKPVEQFEAEFLIGSIQQRIPSLIFDLASNALSDSDFSALSKDEKFMKTLKETKKKFDKQYEGFMERQSAAL